jgi:hypothetical protein
MQIDDESGSPAVFVLVLREYLVARDIEMIIRGLWADALVMIAGTLDEAMANLPDGKIVAAFVQEEAAAVADSDLDRKVSEDGGQTVLVGLEPGEMLPRGWAKLSFPFVEKDVQDLFPTCASATSTNIDHPVPC